MEAVLEVADSSMTYRRRYLTSLQPAAILDLLLADETNPRSVAFQLAALSSDIDELPRASTASSPRRSPEERLILRGLTAMRLIDIQQESEIDEPTGRRQRLDDLLDCTAQILQDLSNTLSQSYLAHATLSRQLGTSTAESP
jgi:uncharacterized alpha-E superfamily protein